MKTSLVRRATSAVALATLTLALCPAPRASAAPPPPAAGAFVLSFERAAPEHANLREFVETSSRFQQVTAELNATFALPTTIRIVFREGDGPQYDPNTHTITMNYDFVDNVVAIFNGEDGEEGDELAADVLGTCEFVLYHEMGHALVHVYDLPVTGKEEDAVDALATVMAVVTERQEIALAGADLFAAWASRKEEFSMEDFWDEHSLDAQRTYAIVCWIYGSDPQRFAQLSQEVELTEEREARCEQEWQQKERAWLTLLGPHLKGAR